MGGRVLRLAFVALGAAAGFALGGGAGAKIGAAVGALIGGALFPAKEPKRTTSISTVPLQTAAEFRPIPVGYGTFRTAGNVLEQSKARKQGEGKKGKSGGKGDKASDEGDVHYKRDAIIGVCEGPADILRVWAGDKELKLADHPEIVTYRGTADQEPDSYFVSSKATLFGQGAFEKRFLERPTITGAAPTYTVAHPPIVAGSESIWYYTGGFAGDLGGTRVQMTRVASAPGQDQYTVNASTGLLTFGGAYSNVRLWISYRGQASIPGDAYAYRHITYAALRDFDLGPIDTLPNFTWEVRRLLLYEDHAGWKKVADLGTGAAGSGHGNDLIALGVWRGKVYALAAGENGSASTQRLYRLDGGTLTLVSDFGEPEPISFVDDYHPMVAVEQGAATTPAGLYFGVGKEHESVSTATRGRIYRHDGTATTLLQDFTDSAAMGGTLGANYWGWHVTGLLYDQESGYWYVALYGEFFAASLPEMRIRVLRTADLSTDPWNEITQQWNWTVLYAIDAGGTSFSQPAIVTLYKGPDGALYAVRKGSDRGDDQLWVYRNGTVTLTGGSGPGQIDFYQIAFLQGDLYVLHRGHNGTAPIHEFRRIWRRRGDAYETLVDVTLSFPPAPGQDYAVAPIGSYLYMGGDPAVDGAFRRWRPGMTDWETVPGGFLNANEWILAIHPAGFAGGRGALYACVAATANAHDENPVRILRDYVTNDRYGLAFPERKLRARTWEDEAAYIDTQGIRCSPVISEKSAGEQIIEDLLTYCDGFLTYSQGALGIKIRKPGETPVATITRAKQRASKEPIASTVAGERSTVNLVRVQYRSRGDRYEYRTAVVGDHWARGRWERILDVDLQGVTEFGVAWKLAMRAWLTRGVPILRLSLPLMPSEALLDVGDLVTINDPEIRPAAFTARIVGISDGEGEETDVDFVEELESILAFGTPPLEEPGPPDADPDVDVDPGASVARVYELPSVQTGGIPAIWVAAGHRTQDWGSAAIYASRDGTTYTQVAVQTRRGRVGELEASLPLVDLTVDESSALDVILPPGAELAAVPRELWYGGANAILVDSEIIFFRDITLLGNTSEAVPRPRYRLQGLVRGAQDTDIAAHAAGAIAVVLDEAPVRLVPVGAELIVTDTPSTEIPWDWVGATVSVKVVSRNVYGLEEDLASVTPISLVYKALGGMPHRPTHLAGNGLPPGSRL